MGAESEHEEWLRAILNAERVRRGMSFEQVARSVGRLMENDKVSKQQMQAWARTTHLEMEQWHAWARALGFRFVVELVREDDPSVHVPVPPDVVTATRLLSVLAKDDRALAASIIERLSQD